MSTIWIFAGVSHQLRVLKDFNNEAIKTLFVSESSEFGLTRRAIKGYKKGAKWLILFTLLLWITLLELVRWFLKTEASPRTILVQFSRYPWPILYLFWSYFKSILTLHFSSNVQSKYFVSYFKSILVNSYLTKIIYIFTALCQAKNSVEISKKQKSQKYQTNVAFEILKNVLVHFEWFKAWNSRDSLKISRMSGI